MQLIYKASNITEAQIVKGMLEANGIEAYVGGYYLQGGVGEISTMDFANVQVANEDMTAARAIIVEYERNADLPKQEHSSHSPQKSTVATKLLIVVIAAGLTWLLFNLIDM